MTTVVVTGLGATTPLGGDVATTWAGMLAGRSGVRGGPPAWPAELPVRIAGFAAKDPGELGPGPDDGSLPATRTRGRS